MLLIINSVTSVLHSVSSSQITRPDSSSAAFIFDSSFRAQLPALDKKVGSLLNSRLEECWQMLNILQTSGHELSLPKEKEKAHWGNFVTVNQLEGGPLKDLQTAFIPAMDHTFNNIKNRAMKQYTGNCSELLQKISRRASGMYIATMK